MGPSSINALTRTVAGIFRNHFARKYAGAQLAPIIAAGPNGEYQIVTKRTRLGPNHPVRKLQAQDRHRRADLEFGKVEVALDDYDGLYTTIPDAIAEGLLLGQQAATAGTAFSAADEALKELSNYLMSVHEKTVAEDIEALDAAADPLDLTSDSADVIGFLEREVQAIYRTSGGGMVTGWGVSKAVAGRMRTLDDFQLNGVSVSDARRAGGTPIDQLPNIFKERTGLDLIISDALELDASGEGRYILGAEGVLLNTAGGAAGKTTLKTFAQQGGDLFVPTVRRTANDERDGIGITNEGRWKVEAVEPETGLRVGIEGVDVGPTTPGS